MLHFLLVHVVLQEFVLNNSVQSQPLLQAILVTPTLVGLLAPNFSPNASPDLFVTMYENMINVPTNQGCDIAFTLLSKVCYIVSVGKTYIIRCQDG